MPDQMPDQHTQQRSAATLRVLCVDDNADFARLYATIVSMEEDMESVGVLHSADLLTDEVRERNPDVILLDLAMPGRDPLAAMRELAQEAPQRLLIAFSGTDDRETVARAKAAGAAGLISKGAEPSAVLDAIRRLARSRRGGA
jgi:DNA-binding NarL/FixJ family response regulator